MPHSSEVSPKALIANGVICACFSERALMHNAKPVVLETDALAIELHS